MTDVPASQTLFTEVFPIKQAALPTLVAYRLEVKGSEYSTVGGKLAYRLKKTFSGHWAWAGGLIVTDNAQDVPEIMKVVTSLWSEQPETFKGLRTVTRVENWSTDARSASEFVARGLLADVDRDVQSVLGKPEYKQDLGAAIVERIHEVRGWTVDGLPAVSVSISSRLVLKQDLKTYATKFPREQLIGLQVAAKSSSLKGELIEVVGTLATERTRLLALTRNEDMQNLLSSAPDSELVVTVSNGRNEYDYAVGALRIILYPKYLSKFGVNAKKALAALRLEPDFRADMVRDVSQVMVGTGYLERSYNSRQYPTLFRTTPFVVHVKFGNGSSAPYSEQTIISDLRNRKPYRVANKFKDGTPISVGILNALEGMQFGDLWGRIEGTIRPFGLAIRRLGEIAVKDPSRAELDSVVSQFQVQEPDILVAFFPDDYGDDDDDETAYHHFKSLTVGRGIPSQVIEASTIENQKSLASTTNNVVLGILGKTGNTPYVLAQPLEFADIVVGIDIARDKKKRLAGSINATAIARIYLSDGEFVQYVIHDAPLEGETVPPSVLQALFPKNEFTGKRVVVQRDGYFRGEEKRALLDWATKIGALFYPVEVIKTGSPRIYRHESRQVDGKAESYATQPQKGSAFVFSPTEATLVSSLPPFKNATPQPLRIRSEAPLSIEQAIESVLALTNLHYGSVRSPRLPVTIHYSDKIAYMALRGIKPKNLEGRIPFWL